MNVKKVVLVSPRGFCAGVRRAVEVVEDCLKLFGSPVYVKHEIVHNKKVVEELEQKGAVTVEDLNDVPENSVVVFSAHGSPPEHYKTAEKRNLKLIDATCPLVTKVHLEVKNFAKEGFKIIYVCHKDHIEAKGVIAELESGIYPVETPEDVEKLNLKADKLVFLTQTTLSVDEAEKTIKAIKKKFPYIIDPPKQDICYATTNRQSAIKKLVEKVDLILVIGSKTSSNSKRLAETAVSAGKKAFLIDGPEDLKEEWFDSKVNIIGITAGASSPEKVVEQIVEYFTEKGAEREQLVVMEEKMKFVEPFELTKIKKEKKEQE